MSGAKRRKNGTWAPGVSGNITGRSTKQREIEELAQEALDADTKDGKNKAIMALAGIMEDTDERAQDRINATKLLMAYAYGNPKQRTEITGKDGESLYGDVRELSRAQLMEIAARDMDDGRQH